MNINRNNCESFFLDYYEKNLSPVEVAEVLFFLEEHPDLKEVFESYEAVSLEHEKINFPDKESLKKKYTHGELEAILSSPVTISNCEQFFVASAEEILTDEQTRRLYAFLAQHPEKKKEFELIQKCRLEAAPVLFEHKELLKRSLIQEANREEFFVRSLDGDLSATEQKQLDLFLKQNPQYKKEMEAFGRTVLVPEKINFEFKEALKKKERKPVIITLFTQRSAYYAAAAAVLLLAGLFFFFRSSDNTAVYVADKTENTPSEPAIAIKENTLQPTAEAKKIAAPAAIQEQQAPAATNKPANKNSSTPLFATKNENAVPLLPLAENKAEAPLMAKTEEEMKKEVPAAEAPVLATNTETKQDSTSASAPMTSEAIATNTSVVRSDDGYQSLGSVINTKLRGILGIRKTTPCESSDKIGLWDLAMAAKNGVQKIIGTKALDVNKVCDGKGQKVEYVSLQEILRSAKVQQDKK